MRLLIVSDSGVPSGYGRIADELGLRLHERGVQIHQISLLYDGLLRPMYDGRIPLPYHVASVAGHPEWPQMTMAIAQAMRPDAVLVIQDMPYVQQVRDLPLDWSAIVFGAITPIDGVPIHPAWVETLKKADLAWSISAFGAAAMRDAGIEAHLCRPGIDPNFFFRRSDAERKTLRARAGLAEDAFILGSCAQNQGRKLWPQMLEAFFRFAKDKPASRFIANTEAISPIGWDLIQLCVQRGWDRSKILFRQDLAAFTIAERYNLMDAHMVLASREGFGLPLIEAQACGAVSIAMDYCSGTEICGDGKGVLIPPIAFRGISTWGGAEDCYPNMEALASALQHLFDHPEECQAIAKRGMEHARGYVWVDAVDSVYSRLSRAVETRQKQIEQIKAMQSTLSSLATMPLK